MTEARAAEARRFPAERLLVFGDAVVAIAMTLLALPLVELVPEAGTSIAEPADLVRDNLVPLGSFLLTFFVIWRIWWVHHELFNDIATLSPLVMNLNVLWLLSVLVLPFPAKMVAVYGADPFVLDLYIAVLLGSCLSLTTMAFALKRLGHERVGATDAFLPGLVGNCASLALALVAVSCFPGAGFWPLLLLVADGPVRLLGRRLRARA